jgi:hypothetical protein
VVHTSVRAGVGMQRAGYSGAGRRPWRNLENRGLSRHGHSHSKLLDCTVG